MWKQVTEINKIKQKEEVLNRPMLETLSSIIIRYLIPSESNHGLEHYFYPLIPQF